MLTHSIPFSPEHAPDFFVQFPAGPAVFALRGAEENAEPYISKTASLRRRLQRLLAPPESQSRRLNLRERVVQIEYSLTGSDFESTLLLYRLLRRAFPGTYQKRLRLVPAPLIKLNLENAYPRAYVTNKLGRLTGRSLYYGPFRSRAVAEKFMNDSLDLFKVRRCTFELNPDPKYPGCVYSEMKMCLAPCFKGCTDEAYMGEVARVQAYFDSGGESLVAEMEAERDRLSTDLDFEAAAQQHARITKLKSILSTCDEICRRLDQLEAVVVQPRAQKGLVALFRFHRGELAGPEPFTVEAQNEDESESLEHRLKSRLEQFVPAGARTAIQFTEELALLKRWYYRSHKAGEIVLAKSDGELPLRKLANAVRRIAGGEKQPAEAAEVAQGSSPPSA
ncbi:MAG TPA: excinuclease ABC subunit C [Candidatus Angelobacter sp.]